jgi:predicted DNA binding CopG/RHH family protein
MNKKTVTYTDPPKNIARALEESVLIEDFLPPPDELIFKKPKVKVTMAMNSDTINVFKAYAKKHDLSYQNMISEIVDRYAMKYKKTLST